MKKDIAHIHGHGALAFKELRMREFKWNRLVGLFLVLMVVGVAAGCGGGDGDRAFVLVNEYEETVTRYGLAVDEYVMSGNDAVFADETMKMQDETKRILKELDSLNVRNDEYAIISQRMDEQDKRLHQIMQKLK